MILLNKPLRPVKVVIATAGSGPGRQALYVPVWKSGSTSTVGSFLGTLYGAKCIAGPHHPLAPAAGIVRVAANHSLHYKAGPISASPGVADALHSGTFAFTVVRDPMARFVASLISNGHGDLPLCKPGTDDKVTQADELSVALVDGLVEPEPCNSTLRKLAELANALHNGSFLRKPGYEHQLSQTYFMSATDDRGARIQFDAVARLERYEDDMVDIATELNFPAVRDWQHGWLGGTHIKNVHSQGHLGGTARYVEALRKHLPEIVCLVQQMFAQDYDCLGYERLLSCTGGRGQTSKN